MQWLERIGGRKFIVFLAGTALLLTKAISQDVWLWVCVVYVGGNIAETLATKFTGEVKK